MQATYWCKKCFAGLVRASLEDANAHCLISGNPLSSRRTHAELQRSSFVHAGAVAWHGKVPNKPDWSEESRLVAYTLSNNTGGGLYIAFNTSHKAQIVQLPLWPNRAWQLISDSGQVSEPCGGLLYI